MRNLLRQKFIKVLALLAITNAVFVGGVAHAYDFKWQDFQTSNFIGTGSSVQKTNEYWQITLTGVTNGGVSLGMPYYYFNSAPMSISPWSVRYDVISTSGGTTCTMRPTISSTNALTGANTVTLSATGASTSLLTFTSPSSNNGQQAVTFQRNTGTCDLVVRVYEVLANNGTVLWNPTTNLQNVTLNVTTGTSSGGGTFPSEIAVTTENDQLWNFLLLTALFFGTILFIIVILRPLYVRK